MASTSNTVFINMRLKKIRAAMDELFDRDGLINLAMVRQIDSKTQWKSGLHGIIPSRGSGCREQSPTRGLHMTKHCYALQLLSFLFCFSFPAPSWQEKVFLHIPIRLI